MEEWRAIGSPKGYDVSDMGNVRSWFKQGSEYIQPIPRLLKVFRWGPYRVVNIKWRKGVRIYSLVAEAFLGPKPPGMEVLHGPRGQLCDELSNLSYGSHVDNMWDKHRDGTHQCGERTANHVLTDDMVRRIHALSPFYGVAEIAQVLEVGYGVVWHVVQGRTWRHVTT